MNRLAVVYVCCLPFLAACPRPTCPPPPSPPDGPVPTSSITLSCGSRTHTLTTGTDGGSCEITMGPEGPSGGTCIDGNSSAQATCSTPDGKGSCTKTTGKGDCRTNEVRPPPA